MPLAQDRQSADVERTVGDVFGDFFVANTLFLAIACVLIVWLTLQSHRQHRLGFLRLWAAGWTAYLVARLVTLLQVSVAPHWLSALGWSAVCSGMASVGYYLHVLLLLAGVLCAVDGGRWEPRLRHLRWAGPALVVLALAATVTTIHAPLDVRMLVRVGLRCVITGIACGIAGVVLLRYGRRHRRLGAWVAGGALLGDGLLFALHAYAFSFGRYTEVAFLGGFEVLIVCVLGIGFVLWTKEGLHADAARASADLAARTQALLRGQRLESIGLLAGGVAHDFHNVLTVVLGTTEGLLRHEALAPAIRSDLEAVHRAAVHAARLTSQLRSMGREPDEAALVQDLGEEARELLPLLRSLAGSRVQVQWVAGNGALPVRLRRGQLEQVLLNLVVNARDAIVGDGRVVIRIGRAAGAALELVRLSVEDNGRGMSEAVAARVGEPFFTTKGGAGTGLGMATVKDILRQSGGVLSLRSAPGLGTTVTIDWPLATAAAAMPPAARCEVPRPGPATILLVDDDAMVRNVTRRTLEAAGYTVLVPATSAAAEELLRHHPQPIDLLLTDVQMPPPTGPELAVVATAVRPMAQVRFVTGYVDAELQAKLPPEVPLLAKPYSRQDLLAFVAAALAAPVSTATTARPGAP